MNRRQAAIDLCVDILDKQRRLANVLRGTKLFESASALQDDVKALETMLIPDDRAARNPAAKVAR